MIKFNIKKILVPLDGSKNSFRALDEAIYLARQCHGIITGLYVVGIEPPRKNDPVSKIEKFLLENAAKFMKQAKVRAAQNGILFYDKVLYGNEGNRIVSFAQKGNFDVIVIGSRGRSKLKEIFLGSTSNYVLHKSNLPILIVK
jgi:nucleotide-binding universal stress UspA family protein